MEREVGVQQTKTARDKNTVSEFVLKAQNRPLIPVITFVPFYFSFSHGVYHHLSPFLRMMSERWRDSKRFSFISTFCWRGRREWAKEWKKTKNKNKKGEEK
ncbi:hypothetical protein CEXT_159901 [Caerostris extrusa]|uniref:Uncharacterized protein n=1 Tax=Caerostris extrusa TaxID=172846 RepID=A0AAV4TU46_CAEEX|nr:hypothetical protein CEXT_159901 [Caerostris extrusa]